MAVTGGFDLSHLFIIRSVLELHEIFSINFATTGIPNSRVLLGLALIGLIP